MSTWNWMRKWKMSICQHLFFTIKKKKTSFFHECYMHFILIFLRTFWFYKETDMCWVFSWPLSGTMLIHVLRWYWLIHTGTTNMYWSYQPTFKWFKKKACLHKKCISPGLNSCSQLPNLAPSPPSQRLIIVIKLFIIYIIKTTKNGLTNTPCTESPFRLHIFHLWSIYPFTKHLPLWIGSSPRLKIIWT